MGFEIALSGLNAAAKDLQVTGNNIANANTTGFKASRAEFGDVYANSIFSVSKIQAGAGVGIASVAQQFDQGSISATNNSLDLAIAGAGFFSMSADPTASRPDSYTRSGEFKLNSEGFVVNNAGEHLMSFAPNGETLAEGFTQGVFSPLRINSTQGAPVATTEIVTNVNLDSQETVPPAHTAGFTGIDPNDPDTYNHLSSVTIFDSQGDAHIASTYFVSNYVPAVVADPLAVPPVVAAAAIGQNTWESYIFIDDVPYDPDTGTAAGLAGALAPAQTSNSLLFDTDGTLISVTDPAATVYNAGNPVPLGPFTVSGGVDPLSFDFDFGETSQYSANFSVKDLSQDGLAVGQLTGLDITDKGEVIVNFSNGGIELLGQVALTRFSNPQGLQKNGDTSWSESIASGVPVAGQAKEGSFGAIQSGALEASTVDLSQQLVHLIIAQQAYQANAQNITTEKSIVQTILNA